MLSARVYNKEEFWFVDFLDTAREGIDAVGVFKKKEDAEYAAKTWENDQMLENMGESIGRKG
jgi:Uri superfamily endonuclease